MIVLISLEFNHTILGLIERGRSIVQVRAVVLIALLAVRAAQIHRHRDRRG
jgi:uncharacterized Fe-S cluster-containing radical SAM superfamily enzyme